MQRIVIFGAGQSGRMIKNLLHGSCEPLAFIDNNHENYPVTIDGIPVISPKRLPEIEFDKIIVSVLNRDAARDICGQLLNQGVEKSSIFNINDLREFIDIRLSVIRLLSDEIEKKGVKGSIAELGVYQGYIAKELNTLFKCRKLYLFDTFSGFDERDVIFEKAISKGDVFKKDFSDTSLEAVKKLMPHPESAIFCKGYFPDSAKDVSDSFAFVSIDADLYLPTLGGLRYFYPRLSKGGSILIHDYNSTQFPNIRKAVDDFSKDFDIKIIPLSDLHGSAVIV